MPEVVIATSALRIWSASTKLDIASEVSASARSELPPKELASDGRIFLIPAKYPNHPKLSTPLTRLTSSRKAVDRILRSRGIPMLNGIAIPSGQTDDVLVELDEVERVFHETLNELVSELPELYAMQEQAYPKWASLLRKHQLSEAKVRERCVFDVPIHKVAMPESQAAAARLGQSTTARALPSLLDDISQRAGERLDAITKLGGNINQRSVIPVRLMVDKLETFSFVDGRVSAMASALTAQLSLIRGTGPLEPSEVAVLVSVLSTMAAPERLLLLAANGASSASLSPQSRLDLPAASAPAQESIASIKQALGVPTAPALDVSSAYAVGF
jgi:hypothetical protein